MAILALPSSPNIKQCRWILQGNTIEHISPFTRSIQTIELLSSRWMASFTLPPMKQSEAEIWMVWLARLQGRAGRFYAGDPSARVPRGTATGSPVVNGAGQCGISLVTSGWTPNLSSALKRGDYLSWDTPSGWRELHKVTGDFGSDASGNATLTIAPPIRESPASLATITTTNPTCVMALATDDDGEWSVDDALIHDITFNLEEAMSPDSPT
jgi:hypothetical protein